MTSPTGIKPSVTAFEEPKKPETTEVQKQKADSDKQSKIMNADDAKKADQKQLLKNMQKKIGGGCPACGMG